MYLLLSNLIILSKAERLHRKFLYKLLIFCATYYLFICFDYFYYKYFWHYDYFFDFAYLYPIHFAISIPPECHKVCFSPVQTDHPAQQPTEYWLHMNFLPAHTLWAVSDTLHTSFLSFFIVKINYRYYYFRLNIVPFIQSISFRRLLLPFPELPWRMRSHSARRSVRFLPYHR